jgi:predicted AlkP superfamily phosphohydrolase/phosphomutase
MENDTGPDDANHAWEGVLVMAGAGVPAAGPIEGSHLRDVARTVLRLLGVTPPITMGGHDLLAGLRAPGAVRDTVIP